MGRSEERTDIDPLDTPLSRRDVLDLLHELTKARGKIVGQMAGGMIEQQSQVALHANALAQHFRREWSKVPKPGKVEAAVADEAHDAN